MKIYEVPYAKRKELKVLCYELDKKIEIIAWVAGVSIFINAFLIVMIIATNRGV